MKRRFKVIRDIPDGMGLKVGDIVTLVEGSSNDALYELPERLHGNGHAGWMYDSHLDLKEYNYLYIDRNNLELIKDDELIRLELTRMKPTKLTVKFLVESIEVKDDVLSFWQNGLRHRYHLDNYTFTINGGYGKYYY